MSVFDHALVLTGPTGSGKSAIALSLAEQIGAEILSMDSMTLYRGMDIGTAKPTIEERQRVPHHLIDELDPWESASVAWWLERAQHACESILSRGKRPLFVGGTPFYLMALLYGLFDAPPSDETVRQKIEAEITATGAETVHARLNAIDPTAAKRIH
ncbi:MAG: tRNA (adenosine(37)-N6)-dimethylallyltransferase MiaA, partial [Gemmataceae bacterium]